MTGAGALLPTALAANGSVSLLRSGRIWWTWRCGRTSARCGPTPGGWRRNTQRRAPPHSPTTRTLLTTLEAPLGKRRQGLARVIDSDAEALIEQPAFAPRLTRLRQRIAPVEAQRQQLAAQEALDTDLRLIMGRLDDFAAPVQDGLAEADWSRKRAMIRALVKRVEVVHDQVNVVCRIEPRPGDPSAEKKSLQDCRGSRFPLAGEHLSGLCVR